MVEAAANGIFGPMNPLLFLMQSAIRIRPLTQAVLARFRNEPVRR